MYKLKLYITGNTPRSRKLIQELDERFRINCGGNYTLEVVDVFECTQEALTDNVLATPTLIKTLPAPARRIVGNLMDEERMLAALEIETTTVDKG